MTGEIEIPARDERLAGLLMFVAPGFLHGLGNALFAIQGHGQLLGRGAGEGEADRTGILHAADRAGQQLDVVRHLLGETTGREHEPPGPMLERLAELFRVPLRERGLRLDLVVAPGSAPLSVDARAFCRGVTAAVHAVAAPLAGASAGMRLELLARDEVATVLLQVEPDPGRLPFPVDWKGIAEGIAPEIGAWGGAAAPGADGGLLISVPGAAQG